MKDENKAMYSLYESTVSNIGPLIVNKGDAVHPFRPQEYPESREQSNEAKDAVEMLRKCADICARGNKQAYQSALMDLHTVIKKLTKLSS